MTNGLTEEVQRKISGNVQKSTEVENQIRSLISADMSIDEKVEKLDGLRVAAGEYDDSSWEGYVTQLTYEIREHCSEIDLHVSPSIDSN